ncbi:MAG: hypothetical protein OMM_12086, partial [Candidatus Magnetoglobus multicellularis str. Araruama]
MTLIFVNEPQLSGPQSSGSCNKIFDQSGPQSSWSCNKIFDHIRAKQEDAIIYPKIKITLKGCESATTEFITKYIKKSLEKFFQHNGFLEPYSRKIDVKITSSFKRMSLFISNNWQWIGSTLTTIFVAWYTVYLTKKRNKNKP